MEPTQRPGSAADPIGGVLGRRRGGRQRDDPQPLSHDLRESRNGVESVAAIRWTEWMRSNGFGGLIQRNTHQPLFAIDYRVLPILVLIQEDGRYRNIHKKGLY